MVQSRAKAIRLINLDSRSWNDQELDNELFEHYLGGSGIAASLFHRYRESRCILTIGPMSGLDIPFSGGWSILFTTETGELMESSGSGSLGRDMARCGVEAVLFSGTGKEPLLVRVEPEDVQFLPLPEEYPFDDPVEAEAFLLEAGMVAPGEGESLLTLGRAAWRQDIRSTIFHRGRPLPANGGIGQQMGALNLGALVIKAGKPGKQEISFQINSHRLRERGFRFLHTLLAPFPVKIRTDDHLTLPLLDAYGEGGLIFLDRPGLGKELLQGLSVRKAGTSALATPFPGRERRVAMAGPWGETVFPDRGTLDSTIQGLSLFTLPEILLFQESCIRKGLDPASAARYLSNCSGAAGTDSPEIQGNINAILLALDAPPVKTPPPFISTDGLMERLLSRVDTVGHRILPVNLHSYHSSELWKQVPGLPRPPIFYHRKEDSWAEKEKAIMAWAMQQRHQLAAAAGIIPEALFTGETRFPLFSLLNRLTGWERTPRGYMDLAGGIIRQRRELFPRQLPPQEEEEGFLFHWYASLHEGLDRR